MQTIDSIATLALAWDSKLRLKTRYRLALLPIIPLEDTVLAHDEKFLFTSESVTEGHPDKIADQISDAVLDAVLKDDPMGRVACETLVTTGLIMVAGEITTDRLSSISILNVAREVVSDIGYKRAKYGFDAETCGVISSIKEAVARYRHGRRYRRRGRPGLDVRLRLRRNS